MLRDTVKRSKVIQYIYEDMFDDLSRIWSLKFLKLFFHVLNCKVYYEPMLEKTGLNKHNIHFIDFILMILI